MEKSRTLQAHCDALDKALQPSPYIRELEDVLRVFLYAYDEGTMGSVTVEVAARAARKLLSR